MAFEDIKLQNRGETSWITLSRPEAMNAVRPQTYVELAAAFEQADADRATRFIVLTGAGRGFCAGDDFSFRLSPYTVAAYSTRPNRNFPISDGACVLGHDTHQPFA